MQLFGPGYGGDATRWPGDRAGEAVERESRFPIAVSEPGSISLQILIWIRCTLLVKTTSVSPPFDGSLNHGTLTVIGFRIAPAARTVVAGRAGGGRGDELEPVRDVDFLDRVRAGRDDLRLAAAARSDRLRRRAAVDREVERAVERRVARDRRDVLADLELAVGLVGEADDVDPAETDRDHLVSPVPGALPSAPT